MYERMRAVSEALPVSCRCMEDSDGWPILDAMSTCVREGNYMHPPVLLPLSSSPSSTLNICLGDQIKGKLLEATSAVNFQLFCVCCVDTENTASCS